MYILINLWHCIPAGTNRKKMIYLYNSLNPESYNTQSRKLFHYDPDAHILVATNYLITSVDFPNVKNVIIAREPSELNEEE